MRMRAQLALSLGLALLAAQTARANSPLAAPSVGAPAAAPVTRTRAFDASDLERARRLAIATLQDLDLALESADAATGSISASCLDARPLRLTLTITAQGDARISADVTADYDGLPVSDPLPAERFFAAYQEALFPTPELGRE